MNKIREIIEYRTKGQREDFLEYLLERGIDSEEREEIVSIVRSYFTLQNNWTLVMLIDLTKKERIISKKLLSIYFSDLFELKTYYIKLSILDYISATKDLYKKKNIIIDFAFVERLAHDKKNKLIVRNQALLVLLEVYPIKKDKLLSQLKQNLKRTYDYRAHIRMYNTLIDNDLYMEFSREFITELLNISKSMDLGKAVTQKIEELECLCTV